VGCEGCKNSDTPYWDGVCEIKDCVTVKKIANCSYCKNFPCELLLDISLDPDTGDDGARLETMRLARDERLDKKTRGIRRSLIGGAIGATAGIVFAGVFGGGLSWFFALAGGSYQDIPETPDSLWLYVTFGAIAGAALPWIYNGMKRYIKNG
jgi:hypothetical protein